MKILILKPSSLGDVIQALPVLRLLKLHFRAAEIFWWIDSALAPLLEDDPDLAGIVRFERKRWGKPQHWPEMLRSIRWLRAQNFDLVIDLQCLSRSGAFAWLANGKFLIGLDEVREGARGFYDIAVPRKNFHTHAVDWYLSVLPPLGVPVHKNFQLAADASANRRRRKTKMVFNLQPSTFNLDSFPARRALGKQTLAGELFFRTRPRCSRKNFSPRASPSSATRATSRSAKSFCRLRRNKFLNLCGATSLPEMIEWIRLCDLMVTNDTGPMHVAAALGKPLVALFGPTEPRRTGPYGQLENVLRIELPCSPCLKSVCHFEKPEECLRAISSQMVFERAERELSQLAARPNLPAAAD